MASPIVSVTHLEVFLNRKVLYQKRRQYAIYFSQVKVIHMMATQSTGIYNFVFQDFTNK